MLGMRQYLLKLFNRIGFVFGIHRHLFIKSPEYELQRKSVSNRCGSKIFNGNPNYNLIVVYDIDS